MGEEEKKCEGPKTIAEKTEGMTGYPGYYDFYWDEKFLYVNALSAGRGSNDVGLDRNQLG